jgi:protein-S-isoprenylcysteine O-methyltransferase Ste14
VPDERVHTTPSARQTSWAAIARRIRVPLGFGFALFYVWFAKPSKVSIVCGAALVSFGLLLRGLASGHVQKNEELTTSGPYAYTRNPLYLGSLVLAAGFALAARNVWIVVAMALIFTFVYLPVIASEESFLQAKFPEYKNYSVSVPRLLPRLTPFRSQPGNFSWSLYRKHREYNAVLGAALMILALMAKLHWTPR